MRTTKKIISAVLAFCMLATTGVMSCFAATTDEESVSTEYTVDSAQTQAIDDEYAYSGDDLGATYTAEGTTFKVWSPTAESVAVNLYTTGSDSEEGAEKLSTTDLEKLMDGDAWTGIWTTTLEGNLKNLYYTYTITATKVGGTTTTTTETQDVYSVATGVNGERSMICDLDSTDPEGWENDTHVLLDEATDSSVWEVHVKDFSYNDNSGVSEENQGKYLAFTETGTTLNGEGNISTCIDYLKELGVTTVQINPFYDYASVDESGSDTQFNWGYDPENYNVPEGSYSSNAYDGNVRITECKQMIQALHEAGISVVMDVVYNHTYSTDSCFQATVPNYYYRMTKSGSFSNGSGCGNECATERTMYRNYVIQSCLYWVNEYHVDGFRFDLMGIMDVETMNLIRAALDEVDTRITMWGEGWTGGDSYHPATTCTGAEYVSAIQANASELNSRVALFNDVIRDGIKGSVFDIANKGFIQGASSSAKAIRYGVRANSAGEMNWLASAPSQCVTYASCHDNATLYDQILGSTELDSYGNRNSEAVKMMKLASSILYTSQGVTFMLAGEEMCRTKDGDTNSYNSAATLNMIDWENIVDYADVVSYYKGMMQIKSAFTPFNCADTTYQDNYTFTNALAKSSNQISFTVTNDQEDEWYKLAVIYNNSADEAEVTLKKETETTEWVVIANGESAGVTKLDEVSGNTFTVAGRSALIAVDKASFESAGIQSDMGQVKVNYVYEGTGEALDDSVILQGSIGSGYQTTESAGVPDTYVVSSVEGNTTGTFSEEMQEVTYYYGDYVPESLLNADFNDDGDVNVSDVTELQKYIVGTSTLFTQEKVAAADLNYDGSVDVSDVIMLMKHIVGIATSTGTVVTNYYYYDSEGNLQNLTSSVTVTGRVGSDYTTDEFKIVGYSIDPDNYPTNASGKISYGPTTEVNYYYIASSTEITLHIKHDGSLTWTPTLWIWGSSTSGVDTNNFTTSGVWPGDAATDDDGDGWYDYTFNYVGVGTYNVIISNNGSVQSSDYKGFVDNELWLVIDDANSTSATTFTAYTDNPDTNPDAEIADFVIA
ncbi:MAG: type I pullulanase [Clostridiales bacterium]|nr:type I pullulanase [Clostridiales bacterium]